MEENHLNEPNQPPAASSATPSTTEPALQQVALDSFVIDTRLQARSLGKDSKYVNELVEYSYPEAWPPIKLAQFGNQNYLVGGFHRVEAAEALGITHLLAEIVPVSSLDEARLLAYEDNATHGLKSSIEDKKEHARLLARLHPDMSYSEIARRTFISDKTVKAAVEGKPIVEVSDAPSGRQTSSAPKDSILSIIKRLDDFLYNREGEAEDIRRYAEEHIESFDEESERHDAAENLAICAGSLLAAAQIYIDA